MEQKLDAGRQVEPGSIVSASREAAYAHEKVIARVLVDPQACGSVAEMELERGRAAVIVGIYGYLGVIDFAAKEIFSFGRGSAVCQAGFNEIYQPFQGHGFRLIPVENTLFLGKGDDSKVVAVLERYGVAESAKSALDGRYVPNACLRRGGMSDAEWEGRRFLGRAAGSNNPLVEALLVTAAGRTVGLLRTIGPDVGTDLDWEARLKRTKAWYEKTGGWQLGDLK